MNLTSPHWIILLISVLNSSPSTFFLKPRGLRAVLKLTKTQVSSDGFYLNFFFSGLGVFLYSENANCIFSNDNYLCIDFAVTSCTFNWVDRITESVLLTT